MPQSNIVENTYDPTSTNAISGQGVAAALAPITSGNNAAAYGVDNVITSPPNANNVPTSSAVTTYVDNAFVNNAAWQYKGTLGFGATITTIPVSDYSAGWVYKITTAGIYAGEQCEIGDFILAIANASEGQNTVNNNHWAVLQGNIRNPVSGPNLATQGNVAIFGSNKQQIEDSGYTIRTSVPSGAVFTDTHYEDKGTVQAIIGIAEGNDFNLAQVTQGRLHIASGFSFTKTEVSTGIQEVV